MLKILRNKELKKKVIWVVAIVIIISFGFLGTAYLITGNGGDNFAGRIFGKNVSYKDYEEAFKIVQIQAVMRYGENFQNVREFLNLDSQTWDRLILLNEAKRRKIKVYNDEVVQAIEQFDYFKRNGSFDTIMYNEVLKYVFRINARTFEEGIRNNLKMARLYDEETKHIDVSLEEIRSEFQKQSEQVQVSYVLIRPEQFKDEKKFDEKAAKEFYESNKQNFLVPSAINVDFIEIPIPEKIADATDATAESTTDESEDDEEVPAEILEKAQALYDELLLNPDWTAVAAQHDLKVQKSGFISSEEPNLDLGWSFDVFNKVFKSPLNEIQGPFETSNGLLILNVTETRDAYIPEYTEVADKVKDAYLLDQAKEITRLKTDEYLKTIQERLNQSAVDDFAKIAKGLGLEIEQTPSFNRGQYLPNIGIMKDFEAAAFSLDESNKISDVVETANGYCILYLDNYIPANEADFAEQEAPIRSKLLTERKNDAFSDYVTRLRTQADLYNNIARQRSQNTATP